MNIVSPARNLRMRPFIKPPCMRACSSIPGPMYSIVPASAYSSSLRCSSIWSACITSPTILYCMRRIVSAPASLLDALQVAYPDSSKRTLRQMLQGGRVRVNGEIEKDAKLQLEAEDVIDVAGKEERRAQIPGLTILHEDVDVMVVLKANGLLTVATDRERENTAQAYLNAYL